jgi:hypothetical protein
MNAGQRAMATTKALLLFSSKSRQEDVAAIAASSQQRISQANVVLKYRPDLADDVIAGILPLNDAYAQAKARKEGRDRQSV